MSTDWKDRRPKRNRSLFESFYYAFSGIFSAIKRERNLQIHIVITVLVVIIGSLMSLSTIEWLFIIFAVGGMIALELVNTAIERVVDLATAELHPLAKQAKDIAAGAVLVYAFVAFAVGLIIFLPKITELL